MIQHLEKCHFRYNMMLERKHAETEVIKIPPTFSVSENIDEVVGILRRMYSAAMDYRTKMIKFDHKECVVYCP